MKIKKNKPSFCRSIFFLTQFPQQKMLTTVGSLSQRVLIKQQTINENFLQSYYKFNKTNNYKKQPSFYLNTRERQLIAHVKNYDNKPY